MRIAHVIFAGAVTALAALTTPVLAKHSDAQKADDQSASSSSCSAYQQAPDGSWTKLPCNEQGGHDQTPAQRHSAAPASTRTR